MSEHGDACKLEVNEASPSVARIKFLAAMGKVYSLVSIVTTDGPAGRFAVTVSAVSSASADPPMMFACIHRRSPVNAAIHTNGIFCVNVLAIGQEQISDCFAGKDCEHRPFDFAAAHWTACKTGAPVLRGVVAAFDCLLHSSHGAGSHTAFFGRVLETIEGDEWPLIYGRKAYARPWTD